MRIINTGLIVVLFGVISALVYDSTKRDLTYKMLVKQNMDVTYQLAENQCILDAENKKPNSEACDLADEIETKMSGIQKEAGNE